MKPSSYENDIVRKWIRERELGRANGIYYLAEGILREMGEEKGTELIVEQIRKMGYRIGGLIRNRLERQGIENNLKTRIKLIESTDNSTNIAWDRVSLDVTEDEFVIKFSYCPIAEGFKLNGDEGVKIGELFCDNIDDAVSQGFNPNLSCKRESSLNIDGLCTLHFKMKK